MNNLYFEILTQVIDTNRRLADKLGEVSREAITDHITNLYNWSAFDKFCDQAEGDWSVVVFDIDNFNRYNNEYGHLEGNAVLRTVGDTLIEAMRDSDESHGFRFGGDEFVLVVRGDIHVARRVCASFQRILKTNTENGNRMITVSAGVSKLNLCNPSASIRSADVGLYKSKALGKDRISVA